MDNRTEEAKSFRAKINNIWHELYSYLKYLIIRYVSHEWLSIAQVFQCQLVFAHVVKYVILL